MHLRFKTFFIRQCRHRLHFFQLLQNTTNFFQQIVVAFVIVIYLLTEIGSNSEHSYSVFLNNAHKHELQKNCLRHIQRQDT